MRKSVLELFPGQIKVTSLVRRFPGVTSPCWLWLGEVARGYGVTVHQGKRWVLHRLSHTLSRGPIPSGFVICHKCDVSRCCNPDHLFLGTPEENVYDHWKWDFVVDGKFLPGDYDAWRPKFFQFLQRREEVVGAVQISYGRRSVKRIKRLFQAGLISREENESFKLQYRLRKTAKRMW